MNKIKILPKELADKIAAGEVVERPASVVKELLENALDALSSNIEINIEDAGRKLIKLSDDGEGMTVDDLKLSCWRHATSKIITEADLNKIDTFGFRGEALASIAAVSESDLSSRFKLEQDAWRIEIEGGVFKGLQPTARTVGTTVEVRNLFFNTPARLKFLKSHATEMFHIIRIVSELALAHPEVAFKLTSKNEEIINLAKSQSLKERIGILLGDELARQLVPLSFEMPNLKINGFMAKAGFGKSNRNSQYIFVNKRPVIDKTINHAITQGYYTLLPEKLFPALIIFIETTPSNIDVNVHPTKREIRFRDSVTIHDVLAKVIKDTLAQKQGLPKLINEEQNQTVKPGFGFTVKSMRLAGGSYVPELIKQELVTQNAEGRKAKSLWLEESDLSHKPQQASLYLQAKNTYIILSDENGVIIIDQHAAHERILFDGLMAQFRNKRIEKQRLLLPITLHLNKAQLALIKECKNLFEEIGFELEEFGKDAFIVNAYPAILGKADISALFENALSEITDLELSADMEKKIAQFLAPFACHGAIRSNERLTQEQITSLLAQLEKTTAPNTCAHGRPTTVRISWDELERKFHRK